jgi:tetrahydromethanopterin S-methyltransferase subunit G
MNRKPEQTEKNILTRKQREAIPHLIGARSLEEGRINAKVSKTTLYEWLKDETFNAELERQRETVISEALNRLKAAIGKAVEELTGLMDSTEESIKLRACDKVLDHFLKVKEIEEIETRLSELEKTVAARGKDR